MIQRYIQTTVKRFMKVFIPLMEVDPVLCCGLTPVMDLSEPDSQTGSFFTAGSQSAAHPLLLACGPVESRRIPPSQLSLTRTLTPRCRKKKNNVSFERRGNLLLTFWCEGETLPLSCATQGLTEVLLPGRGNKKYPCISKHYQYVMLNNNVRRHLCERVWKTGHDLSSVSPGQFVICHKLCLFDLMCAALGSFTSPHLSISSVSLLYFLSQTWWHKGLLLPAVTELHKAL